MLVFSKTAGFRHASIEPGIAALGQLAAAAGFQLDTTEDGDAFTPANLRRYQAVVFLSTTGDILDEPQQLALWSSPDLCVKAEEAPRLRLGCLGDLLFLEE